MDLLARYVDHLRAERNLSPYTVRNYQADVGEFLGFMKQTGIESVRAIDRVTLRRYLAWLEKQGRARTSIARKMAEVRSFFRFLVREGVIERNPLTNLSSPKVEKRLPSFLTGKEARNLLDGPAGPSPLAQRDQALLELLYAAGLRVSEVVGLNLGDLSLDSREARVRGKGSKERIVLMGLPAAHALESYIKGGRHRLIGQRATSAVFLNNQGGRLSQRSVQSIVKKYALASGIAKRVTPHTMRHTFATHLLDGGADLRSVQELLGHEKLSTTQIYTHVTQKQSRQVYLDCHPRSGTRNGQGLRRQGEDVSSSGGVVPTIETSRRSPERATRVTGEQDENTPS